MSSDPLIGQQLANYRIESVLGRGGMAKVYYARDVSLQRPVAVKVIDAQFRQDVSYAERFISEARAVAQWRHENIVQVFYADQQDDLYYFVMEHIDGLDLESVLRRYADKGELMPLADVIAISKPIASALDYAHEKGVIHRDVKPSNVMIAGDERVVLTDFGLALDVSQGSVGEVLGTPHYVAPEQARKSADAVPASDIYSFGVMLYEMLTGVVPFDDPSPTALALQHMTLPPPAPRAMNQNLNQATEDVLLKALAKKPEERYPNATALVTALDNALTQSDDDAPKRELPPLPPGVHPPRRSISSQTVTQQIASHIEKTQTQSIPVPARIAETRAQRADIATKPPQNTPPPPVAPPLQAKRTPPPQDKRNNTGLLVAGVIALLLIVGGAGLLLSGVLDNDDDNVLPTEIVQNTDEPTDAIAQLDDATDEPARPTATVTATPMPTFTLTNTPVPSAMSTNTPVAPSNTPLPTFTPTTAPPSATATIAPAEPTVLYPNGRPIQFIWDNNSFYWYNPNDNQLPVSSIDFEALTASGTPAGFAMEGNRWYVGYQFIEGGKCDAIEITESPALEPPQCSGYNAFVYLQRSSQYTFWLSRDNVATFRVLWNDEEVARCPIEQGFCEVRIP